MLAAHVHDPQIGDVLIVLDGHGEGAVLVEGGVIGVDDGGGVVQGHGVAQTGAFAQLVREQQTVEFAAGQGSGAVLLLGVILRQGVEAEAEAIPLRQAQRGHGFVGADVPDAGVLPGRIGGLGVKVGPGHVGGAGVGGIEQAPLLALLDDGEAGVVGVPDQGVGGLIEHGIVVQSQLLLREARLLYVGVAQIPGVVGGAVVAEIPAVGVVGGEVIALLAAVVALGVGDGVKHGGVGPGAVEAQNRDGVGDVVFALHKGEALHVSAAGAELVQLRLLAVRQRHVDRDPGRAARGQQIALVAGLLHGLGHAQQQIGVVAGGGSVAVQVRRSGVKGSVGGVQPGELVQNGLAVQAVGGPVDIDVVDLRLRQQLPGVAAVGVQGLGEMAHQGVVLLQSLGEEIGPQSVDLGLFSKIADGEAVAVIAGSAGIVAQLRLHLAVGKAGGGVLVHQEEGLGADRLVDVGQARALLQQGIIVVGVLLQHGHSRGHEQALGEGPHGQAGLLPQAVFRVKLAHQRPETQDLRGGHGGAGHELILIVAARVAAGRRSVIAVQRVDGAAGSGDLGLQLQGAGDAPGGEAGHFVELHGGLVVGAADFNGAGVNLDAVDGLLLRDGLNGRPVLLLDGDHGVGVAVAVQRHGDGAGLVVDDDHTHGALGHGRVGLGEEGGAAAVAEGDLPLDVLPAQRQEAVAGGADVLVVVHAGTVHIDELIAALDGGHGGVVGVAAALQIAQLQAVVEQQEGSEGTGIVDGGHGEGVGVGAGAAAGVQVDVVRVELLLGVPGGVVAHGNGHDDVLANQILKDGPVGGGGDVGDAGGAGAQGEVHAVGPQDHGVLNGNHVVGVVSAAAGAEDLHDEDLGVGGLAHHAHSLRGVHKAVALLQIAVGGGNAGDVGAVLLLGVAGVVYGGVFVHVVIGVGDLGVHVDAPAVEPGGGNVRRGHQLVQGAVLLDGVEEGLGVEALMLPVQAGVNDSQSPARAVVLGGLGAGGPYHVSGIGHQGLGGLLGALHGLVLLLQRHVRDALQGFDGLDLTEGDPGGDHVACQGDVPFHLQRLAVQDLPGDPLRQLILLPLQSGPVGGGLRVLGDPLEGVAHVQGGGGLQNDGDSDPIRESVEGLLRLGELRVLHSPQPGYLQGLWIDLHEFQMCSGANRSGGDRGDAQSGQQGKRQKQGDQAFPMSFHVFCSFPL